jgi:hypothetical protein
MDEQTLRQLVENLEGLAEQWSTAEKTQLLESHGWVERGRREFPRTVRVDYLLGETEGSVYLSGSESRFVAYVESSDPDQHMDLDLVQLDNDYRSRYWQIADVAAERLGVPTFSGRRGDPGYPEPTNAEDMSRWRRGGAAAVALERSWEGEDVPILITFEVSDAG